MNLKIKVCGMRDPANISEVGRLMPDYMGFILYRHSQRFIEPETVEELKFLLPDSIIKVGVLVNEPLENAVTLAKKFDFLQLHGNEDVGYCRYLSGFVKIIKAFRISQDLPAELAEYQPYCTMFLFDAAGNDFGGNGIKFNHNILEDYNLGTKFILAGGISSEDLKTIKDMENKYLEAIDLNSRFEADPGIKDVERLKIFMNKIREK